MRRIVPNHRIFIWDALPVSIEFRKILHLGAARIGDRPGFKLVYNYQDRQGVDMKTIYYGVISSGHFFNIRYTAAKRYYFATDLDTFRKVFKSLHLSTHQ